MALVGASLAAAAARAGEPQADEAPEPELRVAAVQMRSSRDLGANILSARKHIARAAGEGARVVIFPECALTGYFDDAHMKSFTREQLVDAERQVAAACKEHGVYAVAGSAWREDDKLFNSALIIAPSGRVIERYHKVQLAESWPAAGERLSVFEVDGILCSTIICHDERYPELTRLPVLAGAQVVFYLSHESGLREERKIGPYRAQIQARAVENTVYVVQANAPANEDASGSHGHSRIIAPDGNIIEEASIFGEDVLIGTLEIRRATRANALKSLKRGPLRDWWEDGVKRVRRVP
jgi:predicted amidohydrolase